MNVKTKDKELKILLDGINSQLNRSRLSRKTNSMELLAAEAILKKQLKKFKIFNVDN